MLYNYNEKWLVYSDFHTEAGDNEIYKFNFKYNNCICNEKKYKIVSNVTRHHSHHDIVMCDNCGVLRINPYMDDESTSEYYKHVYGRIKRRGLTPEQLYQKQSKTSPALLKLVKSVNLPFDAKVLDFGGGAGGRLDSLLKDGYSELSIHDLDESHLNYAVKRGLGKYSLKDKYDFIILSHVFEHISSPIKFLNNLKEQLNENGMLYIEVPYIENQPQNYLLKDFHLAHKYYFSEKNFEYILYTIFNLSPVVKVKNGMVLKNSDKNLSPFSSTILKRDVKFTIFKSLVTKFLFMPLALINNVRKGRHC